MIVDGYVRVSQVAGRSGESFLSPTLQREQIDGWAKRQGALIDEVFEEFDESGARRDRPKLLRAIERVERGESDGLVVAYASRFGRSQLDGLLAIDRIVKAGGVFVSASEGLDYSTDMGRHMLRTMLSWAEWELDRTRATWKIACERAVQRGVFVGGVPFGYRRGKDSRLRGDPVSGPVMTELFVRRADGATLEALREWLVEQGVRAAHGGHRWYAGALGKTLKRRVYLGESYYGDVVNRNAHPPLTDPETWERAQRGGLGAPPRGIPQAALLWGMARCGSCGRPMGSSIVLKGTSSAVRQYRCNGDMRAIHCPAPASVSDARLEPYMEALFWQELGRAPRPKRSRRIAKLEEAVERRERELNAYRDNARLPITLGPDRFADGLDVRTRRQARARLDVVQARRAASSPKLPSPDELRRLWPSLSVAERRAAIGEVIDCIVVWPGPNQPIEARSAVFLAGQAPSDLPRPYEWNIQPRAIDKAAHQSGRPRLRPTEDWTLERVRAELDPFLEGRDRWPSFPEFQAAGLATLYEQALRHAHPNRWAQRTGLPLVFATPNGRRWSEAEIRKELTAFLAGRRQWPSFAEFRDAGRVYLRTAVTAFGGPERWACEMGVELPADRRGHEPQWTYPRMREAIAELAKGRSTWPRQAEFTAAGLRAVHKITHQKKLRPQLARELGLALPAERRSPRRWSDDEIRAALDDFLKGRSTWPGHREFGRAGLGGLLRLITMRGEREKWACEYDVDPPAPPFRWTDDKIEAALDTFLEGREDWPTWSEFQQAGLVGLITNLNRAGTQRAWAERYGFHTGVR